MAGFEGTNLLGDNFKEYVDKQINLRQIRLGAPIKTSEDTDWMYSKTSYFRMASSVDIRNTYDIIKVKYETATLQEEAYEATNGPGDTTGGGSNVYVGVDPRVIAAQQALANENGEIYKEELVAHTLYGVPVGEERKNRLGLPENFDGNELAKFLILHGGSEKAIINPTTVEKLGIEKRSGIVSDYSSFGEELAAYGFKDKEWGFVGMPGIESVDIKAKSMGSLREAQIKLRINSAAQLALIDALYFRLGYTMFLEWGNSSHYDNDGTYQKGADIDYSLLFDFLEPTGEIKKDPLVFIQKIEEQRERSCGNYDAILGKVTNFDWEFNTDGTYSANLTIISWGDIIESLQIDGWYSDVVSAEQVNEDSDIKLQPVTKDNESALCKFIFEASLPYNKVQYIGGVALDNYRPTKDTLISQLVSEEYISILGIAYNITTEVEVEESDFSTILNYKRSNTNSAGKVISGFAQFGPDKTPYYYIRLGDILDFIKDRLLLYTGEDFNIPLLDINTDPDHNYCFNPGTNVSADPSKVMIRRNPPMGQPVAISGWDSFVNWLGMGSNLAAEYSGLVFTHPIFGGTMRGTAGGSGVQGIYYADYSVALEPFDTKYNGQLAGNIMNIYLEKEHLYSIIDSLRDQTTGKLPLYKFVKEICNSINECLGGVNKLDVRIKDDQLLEIYDQNPLYGTKDIGVDSEAAILNIYGFPGARIDSYAEDGKITTVDTKGGSFVTNYGIKTEITNELAATISIGAQANGAVVGEDSTMLSKWNFGLVDRIYPEKVDSRKKDKVSNTDYEFKELEGLRKKMNQLWGLYQVQYMTRDDGFWKSFGKTLTSLVVGLLTPVAEDYTIYSFPYMNPNSFSTYVKLQQDYYKAYFKYVGKNSRDGGKPLLSNQIGMIPINVNLEMDGLSGIRIYDQIHVATTFLPEYYDDYMIFIVKGVGHTFKGNRWVTNIDTIAQPKTIFSNFEKTMVKPPPSELEDGNLVDSDATTNTDEDTNTPPPNNPSYDPSVATEEYDEDLTYYPPLAEPMETRDLISGGTDKHGSGAYGASRAGGTRSHKGIDVYTLPGDEVFASIDGVAKSTAPYGDPEPKQVPINTGVKIVGTGDYSGMTIYYFYVKPHSGIIGKSVKKGKALGKALDITGAYTDITNHVHVQIGRPTGNNVDAEKWLRDNFDVDNNGNGSTPPPSPTNPSTKAFKDLVLSLQLIFTLQDTYGENGDPLFQPFKSWNLFYGGDDEAGAAAALSSWLATTAVDYAVSSLEGADASTFATQYQSLLSKMQGTSASDNVTFSPPSDPSWSVTIDADF